MLEVLAQAESVRIGERFSVSFQRTLRIPEDQRRYPLPPGLGAFPVHRVEDYWHSVPASWRERGGVFIPVYQREALWLGFDGADWKPNAVKIGIGKINAVSGESWKKGLQANPQDYLVCPLQPWLDGIKAGRGFIRQFVAMPLGSGSTVEAQLTGFEEFGGIQFLVYEPKPGRFPDEAPAKSGDKSNVIRPAAQPVALNEMGLGAGGMMKQKIYPDPHGVDTWDEQNYGELFVHLVNNRQYFELTGRHAPPTPVDAGTYTDFGLPWYEIYDEQQGDLEAPRRLEEVKSIGAMNYEKGSRGTADEASIDVPEFQIDKLGHPDG